MVYQARPKKADDEKPHVSDNSEDRTEETKQAAEVTQKVETPKVVEEVAQKTVVEPVIESKPVEKQPVEKVEEPKVEKHQNIPSNSPVLVNMFPQQMPIMENKMMQQFMPMGFPMTASTGLDGKP
jgi:hypothetical protein